MIDGDRYDQPDLGLQRTLSSFSASEVITRSTQTATFDLPNNLDPDALTAWAYETHVAVVADLLGLPADDRSAIALVMWTSQDSADTSAPSSGPFDIITTDSA